MGNLRTALIAWCSARAVGGRFLLRFEDLTTGAAPQAETQQLTDLSLLGIDFDGDLVRQSERMDRYDEVIADLSDRGLTYECYCTRKEIVEAGRAPHGPVNAYTGRCLRLSDRERSMYRESGRRPALRLKSGGAHVGFVDHLFGTYESVVDDFVLRRGDGLVAYNLAVVVDDADSGVTQIVRGDDLIDTTPRHILLQQLLSFDTPEYVHVPLVLGPDGERLSKRHGAVGMREQLEAGAEPGQIRAMLAHSIGIGLNQRAMSAEEILEGFDLGHIPREPWVLDPKLLNW